MSFLPTLAAAALSGAISWAGPIDRPTERGAHLRPTPTSGGVAIMGAVGLGVVLLVFAAHVRSAMDSRLAATLALALAMGVIGALDDLFDIGAKTKLVLQAALAVIFASFVAHVEVLPLGLGLNLALGHAVGIVGVALWIIVATNAVNFMDGANGLAPGGQVCLFVAMTLATAGNPLFAETSMVAAWACVGFLPWNMAGRLFQGDAGALFCGFLFACLEILSTAPSTASPGLGLYFGPFILLPFLTDVLLTLAVRARRGQSLLQAHRDHLYQLWLRKRAQPSHVALAWRMMLIMAAYGVFGLLMLACSPSVQPELFAGAVAFSALAWAWLRRRLERVGA